MLYTKGLNGQKSDTILIIHIVSSKLMVTKMLRICCSVFHSNFIIFLGFQIGILRTWFCVPLINGFEIPRWHLKKLFRISLELSISLDYSGKSHLNACPFITPYTSTRVKEDTKERCNVHMCKGICYSELAIIRFFEIVFQRKNFGSLIFVQFESITNPSLTARST